MPLAALYDIHGNLPALEAVLADVRAAGVDDVAAVAERVRATAYPQVDAFATGSMLAPPSEAQMLDAFSKGELT